MEQVFLNNYLMDCNDTTVAIQKAIDDASKRKVQLVIQAGTYTTGTLFLRSDSDIYLEKDAVILEATPYSHNVPIVYYGSSITQGGCASRPGNSYQAIISRRLDADYINLGFSGSGKAEEAMVQYLAELEMSVFVCDYDHNTPDVEYLKKTHLPLYRTVRTKQPNLPIILISAPNILMNPEGFLTRREVIRETYQIALDEGDKNVYFIDGAELFAGEDWDSCTVDGCHPNDLGFYRMAMRIEKELVRCLDKK